ncbi:MAG: alpha/beta fold hydrolase [Myxococcaceae bacterium]
MPNLTLQGRSYHYREEGSGQAVVLLHPFPLSAKAFAPTLASVPKGFRLLVPDARGFGQSAPAPLSMEAIAQDALALLDALEIQQAVIGGVSMGGYAAMALLRLDASRVKALVLSDTQATADDEAARAGRETTALEIEKNGLQAFSVAMAKKLLGPAASDEVRRDVEATIRAQDPKVVAACSRALGQRADSRELLGRFAGPAMVVVGADDAITPPAKAQLMHELLKGSRLVTIDGAGHLPQLEKPEAFNRALWELCGLV